MASVAEGGLFPPIIDPYQPAFNIQTVFDDGIEIKFNSSMFNDLIEIKSVHVMITRQSNYTSLYDREKYPLGIYIANISALTHDLTVTIPFSKDSHSVINFSELSYNEYYKVQVRLSKDIVDESLVGIDLSYYLTNESNLTLFSEWSTVSLIRFIAPPKLTVDADGVALNPSSATTIQTSNLTLSGIYSHDVFDRPDKVQTYSIDDTSNDKEYLSSYQILIYDKDSDELLFESENLDIDILHNNSFNYNVPYYFNANQEVKLKIKYITANLYEGEAIYNLAFAYSQEAWSGSDIEASISSDAVIGKINIDFVNKTLDNEENPLPLPTGGKIIIRRASDADKFKYWEEIWCKIIPEELPHLSFDDFTIESGVLYKYEISYAKPSALDVLYTMISEIKIVIFDHAFLTGEGVQLCVKFNPNISGFKRNITDAVTTTIGSQYPYISRNNSVNYKSFSLSGTIAYEMDLRHQFTSRSSIYGDGIQIYGSYFVNRYINQRNDIITQRKFRELVMDYLCNDIPKLFRSSPEGNILVRITDVNLTPNQQLSRMICDFTCTATEIGECSIENYKLYQIQDFGD